jgi:hypothetical protein
MSENNAAPASTEPVAVNAAVPEIAVQEAPQDSAAAAEKAATMQRAQARNADKAEREARKAELLNKLREAKQAERGEKVEAKAAPEGKSDDAPKGEEPKPEAKTEAKEKPEKDRSVATIAKLSAENRDLKAKLAHFDGKAAVETKADFIAKVKTDVSLLLKEVDDPELLVKLAEAKYRELTPEEKIKHEVDQKLAAYEKKLADSEAEKTAAQHKAVEEATYAGTASILANGFKSDDGSIVIDNSKWPLCQRVTKLGEADAPRMATAIMSALAKDLGTKPTDHQTATFLQVAFDQLEQAFSKKAEAYRLDPPASKEPPKTNAVPGAKDQRPKTINNRMASGGRLPTITPKPVTRAEREARKAEIMANYTRQRAAQQVA